MKNRILSRVIAALAFASAPLLVVPGCHTDATDSAPTAGLEEDRAEEGVTEARSAASDCSQVECGNCVLHARCLQSALPHHLFSCVDKRRIINAEEPTVGAVAIMRVGPMCHVGYVFDVEGSGLSAVVGIDEANYEEGACGTRHGTAEDLKIIGYFRP